MRDGDNGDAGRFTDVQMLGNGVQMCRSWMRLIQIWLSCAIGVDPPLLIQFPQILLK